MGAIFIAFLVIGMAMPVLPLHVHQTLELSTFVVGLVAGTQFGAAILSRVWAGRYADASGAKRAVIVGLMIAAVSGLLYLASLRFVSQPALSATILLLGRALLGVGESFIITGGRAGACAPWVGNTSKVLAWVGSAMFAAFAAGAPIGAALYASYGFTGVALATRCFRLRPSALVAPLRRVHSTRSADRAPEGYGRRLGPGRRIGAEQRRLRRGHGLQRTALRLARLAGLARVQHVRARVHSHAHVPGPPRRPVWWSEGCAISVWSKRWVSG